MMLSKGRQMVGCPEQGPCPRPGIFLVNSEKFQEETTLLTKSEVTRRRHPGRARDAPSRGNSSEKAKEC